MLLGVGLAAAAAALFSGPDSRRGVAAARVTARVVTCEPV